ncbi:hypothetical protein HGRIS_010607 [Hohenbuehelia grisea]|uniref:G domain-containing protein n=1 Tax=Hohenbuehelia grisea TaxID=104357 RepID=A0ABR3IXQ6_9AGAR
MSKWVLPMIRTHSGSQAWLTDNLDDMMKLREKCNRFRVLIVGRANAGKTTILQKICNTTEDATIQDPRGQSFDKSVLLPTHMRGMHDIENEMVFPNNPGFVFHDSRGIEAGGVDELQLLKKFITTRSKAKKLEDRIHVIWYCIPVDNDRIFTTTEDGLFDGLVLGKAPVIAIFTKFDHRDIPAYKALTKEGIEREKARELAPARAMQDFEKDCLELIYKRKNPPKKHVYLRDMHHPDTTCIELAERTAEALESGVLKMMFVSTQRASLSLCMKYSIERIVVTKFIEYRRTVGVMPLLNQEDMKKLACYVLVYFPNDLDVSPCFRY